ncbi:metalloregulator ArsR/SmtB family transcription factor [Povalibacter sp.]|uniref:ArsR/SmtB family transcription factor n=1 Tax=Povalibacter sp. TaxID=1962978 RepID=UPI002F428E62
MGLSFQPAITVLKAAAEPTRLRLLALLARAELTVGEICEIVDQSQPRISRHLKVLSDAGLLDRFREQSWVYYRTPSRGAGRETVEQLLTFAKDTDEVLLRDQRRLNAVIGERGRRAAQVAQSLALPVEVDRILVAELGAEPIGALLDVGTGSGHVLGLLAGKADRAVGIDISSDALRVARTHVHGAGLSHCELQRGDMYDLPFSAPLFDTAIADRVLAQAERPVAALLEVARTLRPGARLIIVEDFEHLAASTSKSNPIATLRAWLSKADFECDRIHPVDTEHDLLVVAVARRISPVHVAA